ncbi:MAG TPA: hypothetical protein PK857_00575 [Hyphomicrobium sp.]|nr:hypothetical protein [Hyphomicrobium sp.]HRO48765.1 hypothetical protein [Hyphomicrobium sp.]
MKRASIINSLTKGVLDEALSERIDLVHYYSGCRVALNCGIRPQGPGGRRPGTVLADGMDIIAAGLKRRLRRRLVPIALSSGMVTAANGGTAANLVSQTLSATFVSNSVSGSPFVLAEIDLGTARAIAAVDIDDFSCATGGANAALAVEYSDGVDWFAFDGRRAIRTAAAGARRRRFSTPPGGPGGVPVSTRYLRIVLYGAAGTGAFTIGRVRAWAEKRQISPDRLLMFARGEDTKFELVLTDRNIDVFQNHRWVAAIPVAIDAAQVRRITRAQSLDTLVLYNEDVRTPVITRQGASDEWNMAPATFVNQPSLSPATAFAGDTDELQRLALPGIVSGQSFVLWCGDEVTAPVTFSGTGSLAAAIAAALDTLPSLAAAPAVTLIDATSRTVEILFSGSLGARRWPPVYATILDDDVLEPTTHIVRRGIDGDGQFASEQTGWPRCGLFHHSRHILGGFRSAPQTIVASRAGDPFDLETTADPITADLAYYDTLDTDQNETIYQLVVGKHVQAFTETGAWFMEARVFDATQPRNWRLASRPGIDPAVPVRFLDDATHFMQSGKKRPDDAARPARVMRELVLVSQVEAQYVAEPKNVLAPKLISAAIDFDVLEPRDPEDPAQGYVVNSDGTLAHLATQRAQEVVAFLPWTTPGAWRSVGVDVDGNVWCTVLRESDDGPDLFLERFDADEFLDGVTRHVFEVPTATITGLDHHEGCEVWAVADGDLWGPLAVVDGQIVIEVPALEVSVGRASPWELEPMPLREKLTETQPFRPPGRIYELGITCIDTGLLEVSVNGGPFREVPMTYLGVKQHDASPFQSGGEMDLPLMQRLFSGTVIVDKLRGWSKHPRWTLRQTKPAPVEIVAVRSEVAFKG